MTRTAIYARFSSGELQHDHSIDDQLRICRAHAARNGWAVVEIYTDAGITGTTMQRPAIQQLLKDAADGKFDMILAEDLDRISRDLADTATLRKRLKRLEIPIVTLSEGTVSLFDVAFKGAKNEDFIDGLAKKVRRGQEGAITRGRAAAGVSYGYKIVRKFDDDGELVRGLREIDEQQAAVVRRIFAEYIRGDGPGKIVQRLNAEGVKGPRGNEWNVSAVVGHRQRGIGVLHNELYIGRLVFNRTRKVRDSEAGTRISKPNSKDKWTIGEAPHLRIIDDATWSRAQTMKGERAERPLHHRRRPKHLLSGIMRCGACDAQVIVRNTNLVCCSAYVNKRSCGHSRGYNLARIEREVMAEIRRVMETPDAVARFVQSFTTAADLRRRHLASRKDTLTAEAADVNRKLGRMMQLFEGDDATPMPTARARLKELEARKVEIAGQLAATTADAKVIEMRPDAHEWYRKAVDMITAGLVGSPDQRARVALVLRQMISKVVVHPTVGRDALEIEIHGHLAEFIRMAFPQNQGTIKQLDSVAGLEPFVRRLRA